MSLNELLFMIVILLANIIQGITGFAGTILAMPFSLMLVGYGTAKPVLNVLGILSGIYVVIFNWKYINWKEFLKICLIMAIGIAGGMVIKHFMDLQNNAELTEKILKKILGVFVVILAVRGLIQQGIIIRNEKQNKVVEVKPQHKVTSISLLVSAGLVHGIFVSGGPLLIEYLSKKIDDKRAFRATISTVWIVLNSIILVGDICNGMWSLDLLRVQAISVPFLFLGMVIGSVLYKMMSQRLFKIITYILLFISGLILIIR